VVTYLLFVLAVLESFSNGNYCTPGKSPLFDTPIFNSQINFRFQGQGQYSIFTCGHLHLEIVIDFEIDY